MCYGEAVIHGNPILHSHDLHDRISSVRVTYSIQITDAGQTSRAYDTSADGGPNSSQANRAFHNKQGQAPESESGDEDSSGGSGAGSGSGSGLASYTPATEANQASHAQPSGESTTGSGWVSSLASYIPGSQANRASQAEQHRNADNTWQSGSRGLTTSETAARFVPGTEAYREARSQHAADQSTGLDAEDERLDRATASGAARPAPGTQAHREVSHNQRDQEHSEQEAQRSGTAGSEVASFVPGAERGQTAHDDANEGYSSSAVAAAASYIPGTEANRASRLEQGEQQGADAGSPGYSSGPAGDGRDVDLPDVETNTASQADRSQQLGINSGNQGHSSSSSSSDGASGSHQPGTDADRQFGGEQGQGQSPGPGLFSGFYSGGDDTSSAPGSGIASDIPGSERNREAQSEQGQPPASNTGSATSGGLASYSPGTVANREAHGIESGQHHSNLFMLSQCQCQAASSQRKMSQFECGDHMKVYASWPLHTCITCKPILGVVSSCAATSINMSIPIMEVMLAAAATRSFYAP